MEPKRKAKHRPKKYRNFISRCPLCGRIFTGDFTVCSVCVAKQRRKDNWR